MKEFWEERIRTYGHTGWSNQMIYHYDQQLRLKMIAELVGKLALQPSCHALDFGCGVGDFSRLLHSLGLRVSGYDLSEHIISKAVATSPENSINYSAKLEPLLKNSYSLILSITVLQHILDADELADTLKKLALCLSPDGYFVVLESISGSAASAHLTTRSKAEWVDAFKNAGMKLVFEKQFQHPTMNPTSSYLTYKKSFLVRALHVLSYFKIPFSNSLLKKMAHRAVLKDEDYFVSGESPTLLMVYQKSSA